ncbi:hypothetical protein [Lysobacter arvi]|uniref:Uncharacterized protein n=1 Tax=Lysobacter arvi TaxID=3038776 RepID=A0ABU1CGG1_9GAMM|nr:hypothetical protein [Lysobacter arvi]MDR0184036.1 hypothetical protein [Lysobacter arvi]
MRTFGLVCTLAAAWLLAGCGAVDAMKEGFQHSQDAAQDIEKSVGSRPLVGFNWSNGSLTNVTIAFEGVPKGVSTEQLVALSRRAVAARFKQAPDNIVISYTVPAQGG